MVVKVKIPRNERYEEKENTKEKSDIYLELLDVLIEILNGEREFDYKTNIMPMDKNTITHTHIIRTNKYTFLLTYIFKVTPEKKLVMMGSKIGVFEGNTEENNIVFSSKEYIQDEKINVVHYNMRFYLHRIIEKYKNKKN